MVDQVERLGVIEVSQTALLSVSGDGGGTVIIRGGRLLVDNANIFADTEGALCGAPIGIDVEATEEMILREGALVTTDLYGAGTAGNTEVRAPSLEITTGAVLGSRAFAGSTGDTGNIAITAEQLRVTEGGQLSANALSGSRGRAGTVTIMAEGVVELHNEGRISSSTSGAGQGGIVTVTATDVSVSGGSEISSSTFGGGQGGDVRVEATGTIILQGTTPSGDFSSGIFAETQGESEAAGAAGTVTVKATNITITDGAVISSDTLGGGQGGDVRVEATGTITLQGTTPSGDFVSGIFAETESESEAAGAAGTVAVKATDITITDGAVISSTTRGEGSGGDVRVEATGTIILQGTTPSGDFVSGIFANAQGEGEAAGDAGTVVVEASQVTLTGGAQIGSSTFGSGQGGNVTVTATEHIMITGQNSEGVLSGVFTGTTGQGQGGNITLAAPQVQLTDRSIVSAASAGSGDAGNIRIAAQEVVLRGGSAVTTTVEQGEASGGNIFIGGTITDDGVITEGVETLTLDGSQMTANTDTGSGANITIGVQRLVLNSASTLTANTGAGTGGNLRVAGAVSADGTITARADTVVLRGSKLTANAGPGMGGRIDIVTEAFLADPASVVEASSQAGGINGVVNVEAAVSNLSEIGTTLPPDFASAAELLRDRCAAQLQEGTVSSLVARGRASVPATPEGLLPSRLYQSSPTFTFSPELERQPGKTDAPQQGMLAALPLGRPQIINGPFPAHAPVALKCNWTTP
jgi:large exoprotein involved in heme utilization and adhesion